MTGEGGRRRSRPAVGVAAGLDAAAPGGSAAGRPASASRAGARPGSPSRPGIVGRTATGQRVLAADSATGAGVVMGPAVVPLSTPALVERAAADRQLSASAAAVIVLARALDGPLVWLVAVLVGLAVLVGAGLNRASPDASNGRSALGGRWEAVVGGVAGIESGVLPGVLAGSLTLAVRLVPFDWRLVLAGFACFVVLDRVIALERRFAVHAPHEDERWQIVLVALGGAFLGFAGVASMVAGAIVIPAPGGSDVATLTEQNLLLLAASDASIAGLLGFRLARLGPAARREAVVSGAGYAAVIALGAGLLRAMAIPQLLGPALLTLLLYLWDALNATTPSIRRDPRWRWQVGLLLVLSVVVIGWNLGLR